MIEKEKFQQNQQFQRRTCRIDKMTIDRTDPNFWKREEVFLISSIHTIQHWEEEK